MHKELDKYSAQDWTIHRRSAELLAQGYDLCHLWQGDCRPAPTLGRKLLDRAAQFCNLRRESVLMVLADG